MNLKVISLNVGRALLVSALFMFISMMVSIFNGMDSAFVALAISFMITFLFGAFPFIFVKKANSISVKEGFLIFVLSWLLSFIFGMLPYVLWGGEFTLVNAWFESVSGFTTTGSTILSDVEALPESLLFWRSSTHFIGGLGVVVFMLLVLPDSSPFRLKLTNIEVSSLSREGYRFRSMKIVHVVVAVYFGLTALLTLLLVLSGMSFFDAINHAFSTVSTGGFSTKNLSIAAFDSNLINIIIIVFMVLGSMHFGLLFSVVATRSLKPLKNPVARLFLGFILAASLLMSLVLKLDTPEMGWGDALIKGTFLLSSYSSTTGFGLVDNSGLPFFGLLILFVAMLQCGCSGSTTGGIKIDRVYIIFKSLVREIRHKTSPTSVSPIRAGGHYVREDAALAVGLYVIVYMLVALLSMAILSFTSLEPVEMISGVLASIGNVGPGFGEIGAMDTYSAQPALAKLVYTADMFLGRVEIYPVLIVFAMIFRRNR